MHTHLCEKNRAHIWFFSLCLPLQVLTVQEFCFSSWSRKTCAFYSYGNLAVIVCIVRNAPQTVLLEQTKEFVTRPASPQAKNRLRKQSVNPDVFPADVCLCWGGWGTTAAYDSNLKIVVAQLFLVNTRFYLVLIHILHYFIYHSSFATALFNTLSFFSLLSCRIQHVYRAGRSNIPMISPK